MAYDLNMNISAAMDAALRIINCEPQFSGILKNKLLKKGFSIEQTDSVLRQLEKLEMLNDSKLAEMYAGDLMRIKLYGPMIVRAKLYEKGVERNSAEKAVKCALEDNGGETELCKKCLNRKIDSRLDTKTKIQRLASKGFSMSAIRSVMKDADDFFSE